MVNKYGPRHIEWPEPLDFRSWIGPKKKKKTAPHIISYYVANDMNHGPKSSKLSGLNWEISLGDQSRLYLLLYSSALTQALLFSAFFSRVCGSGPLLTWLRPLSWLRAAAESIGKRVKRKKRKRNRNRKPKIQKPKYPRSSVRVKFFN